MDIWYRRDSGLEPLISRIQSEGFDTEGMTVPGKVIPRVGTKVQWGNIIGDLANQTDLKQILDKLQKEIDEGLVSGTVFKYKGQVPTYNDLPSNPEAGDVYDVADTGANYVWSGSTWDNLSSTVDLSQYAKITYVDELINSLSIALQTDIQALDDKKADTTYVIELNNSVVDGVNAEINARKAADTNLQNAIDKVAEDLAEHIAEAETGYITNAQFNEEIATREAAEQGLQDNIDTVASDLTDETNARIAADNLLDDRLDTLEGKDLVEYTNISNPENPNRKAIVFKNHDGIFGKDTDGNTRNLAMISKYNVADFGTTHLHTNLNTQQIVTVNDNQGVLTDKNLNQIVLPGNKIDIDADYVTDPTTGFVFQTLTVNADLSEYYNKTEVDDLIQDMDVGQLRQDLDQEIQDRQDADSALETRIEALEDGATTIFHYKGSKATIAELEQVQNPQVGDVWNVEETGANYAWSETEWDKLSETIDLTPYDLKTDREASERNIISKIWSNNTMNGGHLYTKMTNNKGGYALIFNESDGGGSQVYDKTDDVISYVGTNLEEGNGAENGVNVQIYSKNKTTNEGVRINVNTQKAYYLKGANVPNPATREIAVVNDIDLAKAELQEDINTKANQTDLTELQNTVDDSLAHQDGNIQALLLQMEELRKRIDDVKSLDPEVIVLYDGSDTEYTNKEKDFQLSGNVTASTSIAGSSVTLKDLTLSAAAMTMLASDDVTIKNLTMDGTLPKKISNCILGIHADDYVAVRDSVINPETAYNGIEIGLTTGLSKSITIDNVDFAGHLSNNGINVFGMANYGVLTISNCHFADVSNVLRLSNRANTIWTVNIINCTFDNWETGEYGGMILLQDYTSQSQAEAEEANQFHRLIINIQNCTKPDGTKITAPANMADICATGDENQLIYLYDGWRGIVPYSADIYPTTNII